MCRGGYMGTLFCSRTEIGACICALILAVVSAFPAAEAADKPLCSSNWSDPGQIRIGIMLPNESNQCFIEEGRSLMKSFEAEGYPVALYFGDDSSLKYPFQRQQIASMLADGCDVILIGIQTNYEMQAKIHEAHANEIRVISFGSMLMNPENELCMQYFEKLRNYQGGRTQNHTAVNSGQSADPGFLNVFSGVRDGTEYDEDILDALSVINPYMERGAMLMHDERLRYRRGIKQDDPLFSDTSELIARCREQD